MNFTSLNNLNSNNNPFSNSPLSTPNTPKGNPRLLLLYHHHIKFKFNPTATIKQPHNNNNQLHITIKQNLLRAPRRKHFALPRKHARSLRRFRGPRPRNRTGPYALGQRRNRCVSRRKHFGKNRIQF